ncbi:Retrovirus-related Pol polyprotein from type-1 retrotransposable element R1 [Eumeta japonica]|uniref:Retrovirus-related Pol polyprotein from type-1 retrotransposable element R1 n=1 Tax=Eumeta variegata TaxID=151549 RepID=A0A4C2A7L0_EUMVA|nr:Retrovirus-related Pol polyprotein from type-1 retrotransposable element R1 [Eumeta japonica]
MFVPHRAENNGQLRKRNGHKIHKQRLCPGSICGPTFWNIIIDSLLQRLTNAKVHCQAFTDDVVLAFSSESSSTIENTANEAMKIITKWGSENKLNFAP